MSMMNANAAATTAMTANEPLDFVLPEMGDADFSSEELAEDTDGLTMSFPRIKIPAGGVLQFEIPNGDPAAPGLPPHTHRRDLVQPRKLCLLAGG